MFRKELLSFADVLGIECVLWRFHFSAFVGDSEEVEQDADPNRDGGGSSF